MKNTEKAGQRSKRNVSNFENLQLDIGYQYSDLIEDPKYKYNSQPRSCKIHSSKKLSFIDDSNNFLTQN